MVRELVRQVGIDGCGGPSAGSNALLLVADRAHMDVMVIQVDAGVVETGQILFSASENGHERLVKLLLEKQKGKTTGNVSVNSYDFNGLSPFLVCQYSVLLSPGRAGGDRRRSGHNVDRTSHCGFLRGNFLQRHAASFHKLVQPP